CFLTALLRRRSPVLSFLPYNPPSPSRFYTLSLHDALPISFSFPSALTARCAVSAESTPPEMPTMPCLNPRRVTTSSLRNATSHRSEEHTSELQSRSDLVCRLLLEKKKKDNKYKITSNMRQQ